jgi:hypothetical protein
MPKTQFLIDLFPSITMAFDFRKLRSAYSGNAIRVLRTSDNTEQDFPFVANEVVGSDVLDFVGYNLWSYSEEIQQSVWIKEGTTVTENILTAPDGNNTADVVFETAVLIGHSLRRIRVVAVGEEYTVSFFVKANGRDFINVRAATQMSTDGVTQPTSWVDLSTGTVLSNSGSFRVAPTITSVGNDWYFIEFGTIASIPGTFTNFQVLTSPDGMNTNYIGDITKGVAIWGVQISNTSNVKPYQKTEETARGYGSLSKGYDQASGGADVINATIIRQPIIVNSSALITDGGKLALQGGATLGLRSTSTVALSGYTDLFFTFGVNVNDVTTRQMLFESSVNSSSNNGALFIQIQSGEVFVNQRTALGQNTRKTYPISIGRQLITVRFRTGQTATNASQVWINGTEITGTVTLTNNSIALSNQVVYLFARAGNTFGFLGKYQNFTMFTDEAQRTGIENNINNHYVYY